MGTNAKIGDFLDAFLKGGTGSDALYACIPSLRALDTLTNEESLLLRPALDED